MKRISHFQNFHLLVVAMHLICLHSTYWKMELSLHMSVEIDILITKTSCILRLNSAFFSEIQST